MLEPIFTISGLQTVEEKEQRNYRLLTLSSTVTPSHELQREPIQTPVGPIPFS